MNSLVRLHKGFTLIELLIATTLGLIVSAGMLQIFTSNTRINASLANLSSLQETGQFAMEYLSRDIRAAGYPRIGFLGTPITGTDDDGLNFSDSITVSSDTTDANNNTQDCLGQNTAEPAVNKYYIANDTGTPNLYCLGSGSATPQALLEGVENLQVVYGVDTDADKTANKYINATMVTANNEWLNVVSVRISLLLRSLDNNVSSQHQTYTFNGVTATPTGNDYYLRRVFTSTITLRNRLL